MRVISWLSFMAWFSSSALAGTPPPGTLNIPALVDRVDAGVVNIQALTIVRERFGNPLMEEFFFNYYGVPRERIRKQPSLGSGFMIDNEGYILTNHHVIASASEVEVFLNDAKNTKMRAKIIGSDRKTDVALLKIPTGSHLHPLQLGDSDPVKVGESVVAIGNPFGLAHTVTSGIISAKNRVIGQGPYDNFLQTDASINPGNSGGPLFNAEGEVIGINTAINAAGQGLGFAIPVNQAKRLLPDLKKHGRVLRGWIGALFVTLARGVYVEAVVLKSGAQKADMQGGDRVLSVNGKNVESLTDIEKVLEDRKPGDKLTFMLEREGAMLTRKRTISVTLGEEPAVDRELPPGLL